VATVDTVTGPIDADELGTTLIHEHLVFRDEAVLAEWPHAGTVREIEPPENVDGDGAFEAALEAARDVVERGVKTIAEPTAMFGGRDVDFSRRVAEETGLQVVPCTGALARGRLKTYPLSEGITLQRAAAGAAIEGLSGRFIAERRLWLRGGHWPGSPARLA